MKKMKMHRGCRIISNDNRHTIIYGTDTPREDKKTASKKMMEMVVPEKRRRCDIDEDGSTTHIH